MSVALQDKTIIITGASAGIGAVTALHCAQAGMHVVLNARRADRLQKLAEEIRALGRRAEIVPGDVCDPAVTRAMLDCAEEKLGGFYAVFANAGYGFESAVVHTSMDQWREIFEVNFFASVDLVQSAAQRLMEQQRPGHLLMCSSCVARIPLPFHAAYSASKAAQAQVCSAMQSEVPANIHVSSVHPVTTTTEFFEVSHQRSGKVGAPAGLPAHVPRMFVQPPERVARAVVHCLRRPRPEVWTSLVTRFASAMMVLSPRFGRMVATQQARIVKRASSSSESSSTGSAQETAQSV